MESPRSQTTVTLRGPNCPWVSGVFSRLIWTAAWLLVIPRPSPRVSRASADSWAGHQSARSLKTSQPRSPSLRLWPKVRRSRATGIRSGETPQRASGSIVTGWGHRPRPTRPRDWLGARRWRRWPRWCRARVARLTMWWPAHWAPCQPPVSRCLLQYPRIWARPLSSRPRPGPPPPWVTWPQWRGYPRPSPPSRPGQPRPRPGLWVRSWGWRTSSCCAPSTRSR